MRHVVRPLRANNLTEAKAATGDGQQGGPVSRQP